MYPGPYRTNTRLIQGSKRYIDWKATQSHGFVAKFVSSTLVRVLSVFVFVDIFGIWKDTTAPPTCQGMAPILTERRRAKLCCRGVCPLTVTLVANSTSSSSCVWTKYSNTISRLRTSLPPCSTRFFHQTSLSERVEAKGGTFLEAPVSGSKGQAAGVSSSKMENIV